MANPSVVLPAPDSPTTPTVCPARTVTPTLSTAVKWRLPPSQPLPTE